MKNTYTTPADFWQERDFGAKISATFEFIGAHWRPLGRVLLYVMVPLSLVRGIVAVALQSRILSAMHQEHGYVGSGLGARYAYLSNVQSPWYFVSGIATVAFYSVLILSVYGYLSRCVYAAQPGTVVTVPEVWEVVKSKFVGTFFSLIGILLLIAFGFICFFVPGMYLLVTLSLFFVISTLENSGFTATISRCTELIKGKWWSTFGLLFIISMIFYLTFASLGAVLAIVGGMKALLSLGSLPTPFILAFSALSGLLSLFFYVPLLVVLAFQYFNLVERREGVGLRLLVNQLGNEQAAVAAQSSHYQPDEEGEY